MTKTGLKNMDLILLNIEGINRIKQFLSEARDRGEYLIGLDGQEVDIESNIMKMYNIDVEELQKEREYTVKILNEQRLKNEQ